MERAKKFEVQLRLCLVDMESKDVGLIENRIKEVKFCLKENEEKIKILVEKENKREDSFWYVDRKIATFGKYHLITAGDIRVIFPTEPDISYHDSRAIDRAIELGYTDADLHKLEWLNNNWFEVVWEDRINEKGQLVMECDMGEVAHEYNGGIELLKWYYTDRHLGD